MTVTPDVLMGGRYRPSERLAQGGMGEIWRCEDTVLQRPVAIKVLRTDYASDPDFHERFRAEARHAAVLTHPNVTQVFDFVDDETDAPYIVMEYVAGESLARILEADAPLDAERTWAVIGQTAAALSAAHGLGIVHRDIKPGNILVCPDGLVKVTDFGIARAFDEATATHPGIVLGTAHYLAPEQLAGEKATPASDMYSLGVVGYQCLAGAPPFHRDNIPEILEAHQHEDPPSLPAGVPPALSALVLAMLAKDPADRPSDAGAIASQAQRMASRYRLDDPRETTAEPYPVESPGQSAEPASGDPVTRMLTVDQGQRHDAPEASTSAIVTAARPRRGWREGVQAARTHPTALAVGVLVAILLAATLLTTRALSTGPSTRHSARPPTHSASPAAKPLAVSGATVVGGGDHPEELSNITDSSPSSAWYTEHYASAAFGSLKSGIGVMLHTSASTPVKTVVIRFADAGIAAKLYSGSSPQGKPLASTSSAPSEWRVTLPSPTKAQTWLVWITRLAPDSGGYRAGIGDVRFLT